MIPSVSRLTAKKADKFALYVQAVQNPSFEADMLLRFFRRVNGRSPAILKEDFCGTFALCCEWVRRAPDRSAVGVDLDEPTLNYGRKHHLSELSSAQQKRITLLHKNVLAVHTPRADVIAAFNFSYYLFKTRLELLAYFKSARRSLAPDGIFVLDVFGGSESYLEQEEKRKCKGFTYIWEHARYNPITSDITCKIHFDFPDGTRMRNAFVYEWRLWTLPELRELLLEAGFKTVEVYWEGTDHTTGEGNGSYRLARRGEACQSWVCYLLCH